MTKTKTRRSVAHLYPTGATTFGQELRRLRLDQNPPWEKKTLAERANVSHSLIGRLERDESLPLDTTVELLARALRLSREDLERFLPVRERAAS